MVSNAVGRGPATSRPATEGLRREHRVALAALHALDAAAASLRPGTPVPSRAREAIERAAAFIARDLPLHFRREDHVLFPALPVPKDSGPFARMAFEQDAIARLCGRTFPDALRRLAEGPSPGAAEVRAFQDVTADLIFVLRERIAREEKHVFAVADRCLAPAAAREVATRMEAIRDARWLE